MKRPPATVFPLILLLLLVGTPGSAQMQAALDEQGRPQNDDKKSQTKRDDQGQKIGVFEVRLPVSVKEKNRFIGGLNVNNFEVYEDGKRQSITNFMAPSQLPLNIALLIDTSNSVKLKLPFEKDAGEDFIATVTTRRKKDQILLASFDSDCELHVDFTDDQERLIRELRKVKAGGVTAMYDCVSRVVEEKMATLSGNESRRVLVILSDGEDTASRRTLRETIEIAQRYDVTVFGISTKNFKGTGSGTVESKDDKELRGLCETTGGQVFLPSQKIELFRSFSDISHDLRQEYVLFYKPAMQESTGKEREIKVKLVHADGSLFYKRGYKY
ncbi:MAG TPA: VWA domain-containing protein [Blastocatellia bacterium]|nr:VWA domain-containing protein [Blastocatellia bacterium]